MIMSAVMIEVDLEAGLVILMKGYRDAIEHLVIIHCITVLSYPSVGLPYFAHLY